MEPERDKNILPARQNAEAYRTILETIEDGFYEVDLYGHFTAVNSSFARMIGYDKAELLAEMTHHYSRYTDEASAQRIKESFGEVYRTGIATRIEGSVLRPNGSTCFVDISVALIRNAAGQPVGFCGIMRDISEQRRVEVALSQRMSLLARMQKVDMALSQTLNVEQVLSIALDSAATLSGAAHGFIGLADGEFIQIKCSFGRYADVPQISTRNGMLRRMVDTRQPAVMAGFESLSQIAMPLISQGRLLGALHVETEQPETFSPEVFEFLQLLSARVALALDNARLYELSLAQLAELRELEQLKTDIIRVASHDIRSPLAVISGYIDVLAEDFATHMDADQQRYIAAIQAALSRMHHMATNILSLERAQAVKQKPETLISMNDVLAKSVLDARDEIRLKGHSLSMSKPDTSLIIYGNDTDLNEAINNLLNNAAKFTPEGGKIDVRLYASHETGGHVVLEVQDNGIGIEQEHQARLFQPFFRVKNSKTQQIDGTGIGMYLVKKIVEYHGGQVFFQSSFGEGSTFGFRLPLAKVEAR